MTNVSIKNIINRYDMRIVVYVTQPAGKVKGTVVMAHGLSSSSNRDIFTKTTQTFIEAGYRVVRYDATHSLGASAGDPQYCTMTSIREDLDVVLERFYYVDLDLNKEKAGKLILLGHSLGAMAAGLHSDGASALILISAVTDGKKSFEYSWTEDELDDWESIGYVERGVGRDSYHKVRWSHFHDRCAYTLLGDKLRSMNKPVLLISGTMDADRPGTNDLEQAIQNTHGHASQVTRIDLKGAGHSIREPEHIAQVNESIKTFLSQI